ncbi:MAG: hypothetical protein A2622_12845 [Bdellovibrionales bacterium RIFCSPHIGHO2_01_FULL_40_29]|nr:MAG: hypothetical protein A2622_12845 [Bdellovibrionales bacterium RIFCSPHIGHO2_01_FULL_40_29]OFZ33417.1 MAG: hypothetical protein A3D17_14040 [Bdellovibrionales bacterium RIFCSPHIGHO2_02_FULL_40_15]
MKRIVWILVFLGASVANAKCMIPNEKSSVDFLKSNQKNCLIQARFLGEQPVRSDAKFFESLVTPSTKSSLLNNTAVHCRFIYQQQNGASSKFRCVRTDSDNRLFDSRGELVAEAFTLISDGDDIFLGDELNRKLISSVTGKPRKAQVLKVRYSKWDGRHIENYTSSAASRILWALGVPAHSHIMTEKIICFGCEKDPFRGQKQPLKKGGQFALQEFPEASIEFKFDGKRMYSPLEKPWDWKQVNSLLPYASEQKRIEVEVFALITHFLTFTSTNSLQNALVCVQKSKIDESVCDDVVAMSHDIGAAFGTRIGTLRGKDHPRGDIQAYRKNTIFKKGTCQFNYQKSDGSVPMSFSKKAQTYFLERAKILDEQVLKTIFQASRLGRLNLVGANRNISTAEDQWVSAILEKIQEIAEAPCQ